MASLNKVILVGNLGKDPEHRTFDGDKQKASFSLATSEKWNDKTITQWHNVVVWGKLAGICREYLKKGSPVAIVGKVTYREYEKDGEKKYITEIVADEMQMLGKKEEPNTVKQEAAAEIYKPETGNIPGTDDLPF